MRVRMRICACVCVCVCARDCVCVCTCVSVCLRECIHTIYTGLGDYFVQWSRLRGNFREEGWVGGFGGGRGGHSSNEREEEEEGAIPERRAKLSLARVVRSMSLLYVNLKFEASTLNYFWRVLFEVSFRVNLSHKPENLNSFGRCCSKYVPFICKPKP